MRLNERQEAALRWLGEHTDVHEPFGKGNGWTVPRRTEMAMQLAFHLRDLGLNPVDGRRRDGWNVGACANTLSALKRRGLASNDSGGAWLSARWWITPDGKDVLGQLTTEVQT